ncbi:MAG: hypothetical protein ABEJ55_08060 [Halanaeroarchaeum sp.]
MEVNAVYFGSAVIGGLLLLLAWVLIKQIRPWPFPVRTTEFHIERREGVRERVEKRGPSGEEEGSAAAEPVERGEQSLWDRLKRTLYTYEKRPRKVR